VKIGLDAKRAFHNKRGLGNYSRNLISGLKENMYSKDFLYCFGTHPNTELFPNEIFSENIILTQPAFPWNKFKSLWRTFAITSEIDRLGLDIYHGLSHELPFAIEKVKAKKIVTIHDITFFKHPQFYRFIDRQIYMQKWRYSCAVADKIIAIGKQTKRDLIDLFMVDPEKIVVVEQAIDDRFFNSYPKHEGSDYLLYLGGLDKHKNIKNLIEAYKLLTREIDIDLKIISPGGRDLKYVQSQISQFPANKIQLLTNVSNEELPNYLVNARLTVFPSFYEGFGLPVIENYACKTPVVMSELQVFKDVAGELGRYFDPEDIENMTKVIKSSLVLKDDEDYMKSCFELSRKYTVVEAGKRIYDLYENLLARD
jgi:glycosyltransferase involved in cell wall biosynthesis